MKVGRVLIILQLCEAVITVHLQVCEMVPPFILHVCETVERGFIGLSVRRSMGAAPTFKF